jgi:hypothetical protein
MTNALSAANLTDCMEKCFTLLAAMALEKWQDITGCALEDTNEYFPASRN